MTLQDKIHHTNEMANAIQREDKTYQITPVCLIENLPTPQLAGTMQQQRTYAMDKAMSIIENVRTSGQNAIIK